MVQTGLTGIVGCNTKPWTPDIGTHNYEKVSSNTLLPTSLEVIIMQCYLSKYFHNNNALAICIHGDHFLPVIGKGASHRLIMVPKEYSGEQVATCIPDQ